MGWPSLQNVFTEETRVGRGNLHPFTVYSIRYQILQLEYRYQQKQEINCSEIIYLLYIDNSLSQHLSILT